MPNKNKPRKDKKENNNERKERAIENKNKTENETCYEWQLPRKMEEKQQMNIN